MSLSCTRLLPALVIAGALSAAGCSDDAQCEPRYEGSASDEAWLSIVDAEPLVKVGDPSAPVTSAPTEGQSFRASDPAPKIVWSSPLSASLTPGKSTSALARATPRRSLGDHFTALFVGTAWAHLAPVTGPIYAVHVEAPGLTGCGLDVLTTNVEHQLSAEDWRALTSVAGTVRVTITGAYLRDNRVTEGPYRPATPLSFEVAP
ncbi:hypothetical protein L6R52_11565 [Myxococcota bacterium]|nr:hypothetical protein [Myxococcota bacterium]